jgi:hypothetical protein
LSAFAAFNDIEKSKHCAVDLRIETSEDEVDRLPETPGQEPNIESGTKAEHDRRAPECPKFPSVSSFALLPSDATTFPDFTDDVAGKLRIMSLQHFNNEVHSARDNRSSDDSDGGSVLLDPVRKVHPTRSMSLPSSTQTVTVRVAKMRSFYSLENSIESPIEYDYFQALSPEERGMRAAVKLDACVMEGIDTSRFKNRVSTRSLLTSTPPVARPSSK